MKDTTGTLSVHLGAGAVVQCFTYKDDGPILAIDAPGISLSLTNRTPVAMVAGDVENARRLLEAVTTFAAEVERLHAANETAAESAGDVAA
ncbi:hypothetical protein [Actinomadura sediminis]|uniref:Uncharacterized protein n=1 Tax=Actinomadura sediminis TaxID=1038904 RepID=A0ABW3ELF4_9ACTN